MLHLPGVYSNISKIFKFKKLSRNIMQCAYVEFHIILVSVFLKHRRVLMS